ncbi:MAG: helix-turn-helix transcriptional regulator [Oscillatoria sp. SIO1A7]|nr:helix-turn-helix transcriptional regulator [Oscillatoria sp. SIO1A7]
MKTKFFTVARENYAPDKVDACIGPPLSALEEDLLSAIGNGEKYGLEIAKALTDANGKVRQFSPGSLYPTLRRLESKEYVESRWGDDDDGTDMRGGARRRYYRVTESGLKKLWQTRDYRDRLVLENFSLEPVTSFRH